MERCTVAKGYFVFAFFAGLSWGLHAVVAVSALQAKAVVGDVEGGRGPVWECGGAAGDEKKDREEAAKVKSHELQQVIRAKNEAWRKLAEAEKTCLAYQRTRYTPTGYPALPEGWEERRQELAHAYREARQVYVGAMLRRAAA
jgi:hypothetical protein